MYENISGHCPYLDKEHSITVEYLVANNTFRQNSSKYSLRSLDCDYSDECNVISSCPLKQKAENRYK